MRPLFEYERPFVTTAFWYLQHGYSHAEILDLLESRFGAGQSARFPAAIQIASEGVSATARLQAQPLSARISEAGGAQFALASTVGLRVVFAFGPNPRQTYTASVTVNVPANATLEQVYDAVRQYVSEGRLGERRGRHYEGEIYALHVTGLTGLAFQDPALTIG